MAATKRKRTTTLEKQVTQLVAHLTRPARVRWEDETARVRHLIALDAQDVFLRIRDQHEEAVALFSRLRTRDALTDLCRTLYASITFADLARLSPAEHKVIAAFYACVEQLRWYVRFTEDMPSTVKSTVAQFHRRLEHLHRELTIALGPPEADGHRTVNANPATSAARR
jgi:hypothetical protein